MKKIISITLCLSLLSFALLLLFTSCSHEHTFGEWETALDPTCRTEGRLERVCECGEKQTESIPMIDHEKGEWVTTLPPTCTEEGTRERTCICGLKERETLAALDHQSSEWQVDVEATVFGKGSQHTYCTRCNITLKTEEIPQIVSQGLEYEINPDGKTCTITGLGSASPYQIGVPTEIDGYKVVAIGDRAFEKTGDHNGSVDIFIPEGVTYIGNYAFSGQFVSRLSVPSSLTDLADSALSGASYEYNIYENAKYFGNDEEPCIILFGIIDGNAQSVTIHESTKFIWNAAFYGCENLTEVIIPDSVLKIGGHCFAKCSSLENIKLSAEITEIKSSTFSWCEKLEKIVVPEKVKTIGEDAFFGCTGLKNVIISGNLISIGDYAFSHCYNLITVNLPDSLKSLGNHAFSTCTKLTRIDIPAGLEHIGFAPFRACESLEYNEYDNGYYLGCRENPYVYLVGIKNRKVTSMNIHKDTMFINAGTFQDADKLKNIVLPANLKRIEESTFYKCSSLERIVIPEGVTYIGEEAFSNCYYLKEIILPKTITEIGPAAFNWCNNFSSIVLPEGIEVLHSFAFSNCTKLETLVIPQGVSYIDEYAVHFCMNLKSVTIPDSVSRIDAHAFQYCKKLTDLYFTGTKEQWENIEKHEEWDDETTDYTIHCTDGDIKKQ